MNPYLGTLSNDSDRDELAQLFYILLPAKLHWFENKNKKYSSLLLSVQQCEAIQSTTREKVFLSKEAAFLSWLRKRIVSIVFNTTMVNVGHTSSRLWDSVVSEGRRLTLPYGHDMLESLLEESMTRSYIETT